MRVLLALVLVFASGGWWIHQRHQEAKMKLQLLIFATDYHNFHATYRRGPKNLDELYPQAPGTSKAVQHTTLVYEQIRNGNIRVVWNGQIPPTDDLARQFVLAAENGSDNSQVWYILADCQVRRGKLDEINQIPKLPVGE